MEMVDKMLAGDQLPLARLISKVERNSEDVPEIMREIHPHTGRAYCVGITGPPGGGKSTVVDRLTQLIRSKDLTVGIIAVDPTSPFTGGAVLGDRIRMQQHYLDKGVFIRSMATRGSHGGLPTACRGVIKLLDAFGRDIILIETVGVGQTELDIMETSDTTVVVLVPEAGDSIQTMKAGLMEIADVFVVNKADREGADYLKAELEAMLGINPKQDWWQAPVLTAQANANIGIDNVYEKIESHRKTLEETGQLALRRRHQRETEFMDTVQQRIGDRLLALATREGKLVQSLESIREGELDPYTASLQIINSKTIVRSWLKELEG